MKFLFLLGLLVSCSKIDMGTVKPEYLIKFNNVIYSCESYSVWNCGVRALCGVQSFYCLKNVEVQKI